MARCASCKTKVEDGAVRCPGCGTSLATPAAFLEVMGWVVLALSTIPVGLGIVLEGEHNHVLLAIGISMVVLGALLTTVARLRRRSQAPLVVADGADEGAVPGGE